MLIETNLMQWDKIMNINLRASFHLISITVPFMRFSNKSPSITVLSGSCGETPRPGAAIFSVSMAMLNMLVKNTALEVGHLGIRVNAVAPGITETKARESKDSYLYDQLTDLQRNDENLAMRIVKD
jgi:NAD(P)-dependent dehydrogenase (short-subunit alcohol dehydrogenase family)